MSLKTRVVWSIIWASISAISIRAIGFLTILILGKLLSPQDFGLIAIIELTVGVTQVFRDFGLSQALIQRQKNIEETAYTIFFLVIIWGAVLYFFLFITAPWIAQTFGESRAILLIRVISVNVVISSLSTVPSALLEKKLAFKEKVLPETISIFLYTLITLVLVTLGWGVWAIVWGRVGQTLVAVILIWSVVKWRPKIYFNLALAREVLTYSHHILFASILGIAVLYIDNAFVGTLLGATALGFYTFGFNLANLPSQSVTPVITKVAFPTYAEIQGNLASLASVYLKSLKLTSTLTLPLALGIAILSGTFLRVVYGDKWLDSIVVVQILSFYSLFRSIGALSINILYVIGKQQLVPRILFLMFIAIVICLWPATSWFGIVGASLVMTLAMIIGVIFWLFLTNYCLQISIKRFRQVLLPQIMAAALMTGYLLLGLAWLEEGLWTLIFLVITGGSLYFLCLLMIGQRELINDFMSIARALRKGNS